MQCCNINLRISAHPKGKYQLYTYVIIIHTRVIQTNNHTVCALNPNRI